MKRCRKCGETKALEAFVKDKRSKDGRAARCKVCTNAEQRRRHIENGHREAKRLYRAANRDRVNDAARERSRRWRERHPDQVAESNRAFREANPTYHRTWYEQNIERERLKGLERAHRRRVIVGPTSRDMATYMAWLRLQPCAYCGATEDITIDHIVPVSRGGQHAEVNMAPACARCNCSKGNRLLNEWRPTKSPS